MFIPPCLDIGHFIQALILPLAQILLDQILPEHQNNGLIDNSPVQGVFKLARHACSFTVNAC
jgi:hypothetical protein